MKKFHLKIATTLLLVLLTACGSMPKDRDNTASKTVSQRELQTALLNYISQSDEFDRRADMSLLLERGVDINGQSSNEKLTALMQACKKDSTPAAIFDFLLANGADITRSIPHNNGLRPGVTALHLCAGIDAIYADMSKGSSTQQYGNTEGYKILIAHDANKFIKDFNGHSAYSILKALNKYDLARLQAASAKKHQSQQKKNDAERKKRFITTWKRDLYLPTELRKNKYMSALIKRSKDKRYDETLLYFDFLERMNIDLPHAYTYFYGEALLHSDQPQSAIIKLLIYTSSTDAMSVRHKKALRLIDKAKTAIKHKQASKGAR